MKTRINFFRDNLKSKIVLVNLNFLCAMIVFSIFIVTAAWATLNIQDGRIESSSNRLADNLKVKRELIDSMIAAKEAKVQDPLIIAQIEKTSNQLNVKNAILDELKARETQKSNGFSALMVDLASNHQPELWLTNINLDERKLYLEGTTSDSSALPKWVSRLGGAAYFNGKEFAGARMFRDEKQMLSFILSSELDDVKEKAQ